MTLLIRQSRFQETQPRPSHILKFPHSTNARWQITYLLEIDPFHGGTSYSGTVEVARSPDRVCTSLHVASDSLLFWMSYRSHYICVADWACLFPDSVPPSVIAARANWRWLCVANYSKFFLCFLKLFRGSFVSVKKTFYDKFRFFGAEGWAEWILAQVQDMFGSDYRWCFSNDSQVPEIDNLHIISG